MTTYITQNATTGVSAIQSTGSWFGILVTIAFCTVLLMLAILAISSLERYKKLWKFLRWLKGSLGYFGWGTLSILVISIPAMLVYWELHQASNGNIVPLQWTIYPVAIYVAVSLIGYLVKKYVVDRIRKYNATLNKENKKR
jgi:ABC-type Fe3+-siderophore transport system permease subunit